MHPAPRSRRRLLPAALAAAALTAAAALAPPAADAAAPARHGSAPTAVPNAVPNATPSTPPTTSPIKHVVVLFDENISFDHYFGTYPKAANTDGTRFTAARGTPAPVNLLSDGGRLLTHNPNQYQPRRLSPAQALTCDQNHGYTPEQKAYNDGAMDRFVENTSSDRCSGEYGSPGLTMDYFDGNTVTAMWNYAQHYALSDNSFGDVFGPSTPGALNLVSGNTWGGVTIDPATGRQLPPAASDTVRSPDPVTGVGTVITDPDPAFDDCSDNDHTSTAHLTKMTGRNVGDLLNAKGVSWGWFQGGFAPSARRAGGAAVCGSTHANIGGAAVVDYSPHHEPFQYYASTANPHHLPPTSTAMIGHRDRANHQYDLADFDRALAAGNLPAVSYLKAAMYQDGHAGYSDPLDEQAFLVAHINAIEKSPQWRSTAIVVAYDDSDGWYDQVMAPIANGSTDAGADTAMCVNGPPAAGGHPDRCGPGPRLPLLVISPYARAGHLDHTPTTQSSVLRFIEDNWGTGRIGGASFDADAGSLAGMFDFARPQQRAVLLGADGSVAATVPVRVPAGRTAALPPPAAGGPERSAGSPGSPAGAGDKNGNAAASASPGGRTAVRSAAGGRTALSAAQITGISVPGALLVAGAGVWMLRRTRRLDRFNR